MATGSIEKRNKYDAYAKWSNQTVSSGSWATNTGTTTEERKPSGLESSGHYNLELDVAGTYLVLYHANFAITNTTGLRGIRFYINEVSSGEEFIAPTANGTAFTTVRIVTSNGSTNTRMGVFQGSGASATIADIFIAAIKLN